MARQYRFGDIIIDQQSFRLLQAGKPLAIEPKSLHVLIFLVQNKDRLIERRELLSAVWGDAFVTDHVLNRAIGQLRKVLQDDPKQPRYIETVPTLGYRFIADVEIFEETASTPALPQVGKLPNPRQIGEQREPESIGVAGTEPPVAPPRHRSTFVIASACLVLIVLLAAFGIIRNHTASRTRSLAVLPLKNISGDPAQDYLADGMTEELITDLGQIGALSVISPTTAMQYKNPHKSLPRIAQELHVDAVVEGSVTRSGDRLRIDAQLTDAHADKQIWARSFEGDLHDAFALQNQVAGAVAEEIRIKMTTQEKTELSSSRQTNPLAYQALLKGYYFENGNNSPDSLRKSQQYFRQAADLDPHFARAYVGIARSYNFLANVDAIAPGEATAAADAALVRALELDPNLGEAYAERGWMQLFYHWDLPDAGRDFRHAIELNPGDASFHEGLAHYLVRIGKFDEGFQEFERAETLDPLSLRNKSDYCMILMFAKRYDDAIRRCREALEMDPNYDMALGTLGDIYERTGHYAEAHEILKRTSWCASAQCQLAFDEMHGAPGSAGAFEAWMKGPHETLNSNDLARIYAAIGKKDLAFENMERAYEERRGMQDMTFWSIDPMFEPLYSDPRFDAFLKHAGLPPRPTPATAGSN
ncbi:winged helix-turn-helix domain-containing protein [Granulicella sibirica]|uniref:DNA-binding response regulator KdpE n=1 Tax=Granulicella sibirica TaxID=2479048 RepID=A0A4Q0SVI1_9BACT|nr:winged helix-turn-helix domain-containing protein [Granulicella sibirica]RXH55033.1 DNA-binding response regulator KdpE [Granulicella sibirica]